MRVNTKVVIDIETNTVEVRESFEYIGQVIENKGKGTANDQRAAELSMQKQAFDMQKQQINDLKSAFSKYTTQNIGFDPAALASMKTQFLNSNNSTFNDAGKMVREALRARGEGTGANPVGGNYAKGIAELLGAKAGSQSQGLLGVDVTNAQQALANRFNAGNLLSGNAATLTGTQGVAGAGAASALGDYIKAANTGFGSSFTNAFGGALGAGFGKAISGGVSGGFGKIMGGG